MTYDAVVVGAGPNGLSAGIELARNGLSVLIREANDTAGGAARTEELTLPGFVHDVGSAVYPLGAGSPFFSSLPLSEHGLEWIHAPVPLAHVMDGGRVALMHRSLEQTADGLAADGEAYRRLISPFVAAWSQFVGNVLTTPFRPPSAPLLMARFGLRAVRSATSIAGRFRTPEAGALFAGNAAHSGAPLDRIPAAAIGLVLMAAGHAVGWPAPRGGAGRLSGALISLFESLGGTIETGTPVHALAELPDTRATLLAVTTRRVAALAGGKLPPARRRALDRWRYGPGAFKVDWALTDPIPWEADACAQALTVHVGGSRDEVAEAELAPWEGRLAERPFVLLAQPSRFDETRAPSGRHTAWAYCHVPNGWTGDATEAIERQVERFAPGFRDCVLGRRVHTPADLEKWDANLVGGDVNGGAATLGQLVGPGRWSLHPWSTSVRDLYVCSASTPPGGGVHGMCGYHAARAALRQTFGR